MASIPVDSSEPSSAVLRSSSFDEIKSNSRRTAVLEKAGTAASGIIVQTVSSGDTSNAPSGDAVFDFVEAKRLTATSVLDFPSIAAGGTQALGITVTGAAVGDSVALGPPASPEAGLIWVGRVSSANTVTIRLYNSTAAPIDPVSATWRATVFK